MFRERTDAEHEAEVARIQGVFLAAAEQEAEAFAQLMAAKADHELLGQAEFQLRDRLHALGARFLESAVNERRKKGVPRQ